MSESDIKLARRTRFDVAAMKYAMEAYLLFGSGPTMKVVRALQTDLGLEVRRGRRDGQISKWWKVATADTDIGDRFARSIYWDMAGIKMSGLTEGQKISLRRFDAPWLNEWGVSHA
jgi:hypothetical protein